MGKELLLAVLMQYSTAAAAQPWEVARTLLQVQWVPRDLGDGSGTDVGVDIAEDEGEVRPAAYSHQLQADMYRKLAQRYVVE